MGLYKRCEHKGKAANSCEHDWWGQFMHRRQNHRVNLTTWSGETLRGKQQAEIVFDRMRAAVRAGTFRETERAAPAARGIALNVRTFAERYQREYLDFEQIAGKEHLKVALIGRHFGDRLLASITTQDVRDFITDLRKPVMLRDRKAPMRRSVATVNRYIARMRHMWNWAVGEELLDTTPFKRGDRALVTLQREDNMRHRRLDEHEEDRLLAEAAPHLARLIVAALDSGLRRGELLSLTFADLDARDGWIRVRGEIAKSGKTRWVPVATTRLADLFAAQRIDAAGRQKPDDAAVFSNEVGEPIVDFRVAFENACRRAEIADLRWHDLRHEYASRLVEKGVPLSQVQVVLGHASIVTTMRYDNQRDKAIAESAKVLEAFSRPISTGLAQSAGRRRNALRVVNS